MRHRDPVVVVVQRREQPREHDRRVAHRPAIAAGVQVVRCGAHDDLHAQIAAAVHVDTRPTRSPATTVRRDQHVGLQQVAIAVEDEGQGAAADLLLALEQELHVQGQASLGREPRLDGRDRDPERRFVVRCATRDDPAIDDRRLERRRVPQFDRVGRAARRNGRKPAAWGRRARQPGAIDRLVAAAIEQLHVLEPDPLEARGEDPGRTRHTSGVARIGRHAWGADEVEQFLEQAGAVRVGPGFDVHRLGRTISWRPSDAGQASFAGAASAACAGFRPRPMLLASVDRVAA